jgi:hypothetical protein
LVDAELLFDQGQYRHDQQGVGYIVDKVKEAREDREVGLAW